MALALNPTAPLQKDVRRVALERIDLALDCLADLENKSPKEIEEAVHEVRKRCKELRALARLVRSAIGNKYAPFNKLVRDAADELGSMRDAHAVLGTLDDLRDAQRHPQDEFGVVRSVQAEVAEQATSSIRSGDPRIRGAEEKLIAARRLVRRWKLPDDLEFVAEGLAACYAQGRKDLRRARKRPDDARMHEWRKAVKRLWYHVRLLEPAAPSVLSPLCSQLDDLAEALGDDHDLAVLVERLEVDRDRYGGKKVTKRAVKAARIQQDDLRGRAFRLGATLYAETSVAFVSRMTTYWSIAKRLGPERPTGGIAELLAEEQHEAKTGGEGPITAKKNQAVTGGNRRPAKPSTASVERERKFLVDALPQLADEGTAFRQGYLAIDGRVSVRVRDAAAEGCSLTAKAGRGAIRLELEWPLTSEQFDLAWQHTGTRHVSKTRHRLALIDRPETIEIDVYHDDLDGLIVAEVEFDSDEAMAEFIPPDWFSTELTDDERYTNAALAVNGRP